MLSVRSWSQRTVIRSSLVTQLCYSRPRKTKPSRDNFLSPVKPECKCICLHWTQLENVIRKCCLDIVGFYIRCEKRQGNGGNMLLECFITFKLSHFQTYIHFFFYKLSLKQHNITVKKVLNDVHTFYLLKLSLLCEEKKIKCHIIMVYR